MTAENRPTDITLLGLGPGDPKLITREAWEMLTAIPVLYVRTREHPTLQALPDSLTIHSFDEVYETRVSFQAVYQEIVQTILELGKRPEGVVYAVPGDPFVAEETCGEIQRRAEEQGLTTSVVSGVSYLEPAFAALGVDPLPHTALVDALALSAAYHPPFPPDVPALIAQVYSRHVASEIKLTLMAVYPDHHPVFLIHGAGTSNQVVEEVLLYEIDRSQQIGLLTSLYVPRRGRETSFEGFQNIIAHLRSPEGCPWDREQDHQTLRPNLLEETYEVLTALDADDTDAMREEFGDLLLQIVLHAQIAHEYGEFDMAAVIEGISTKLVKRHPHVFGDEDLDDAGAVIRNWERIKAEERNQKHQEKQGILDGVAQALPALTQAQTYQKRAARVGFDWPEIEGVKEKVLEELQELGNAEGETQQRAELGDLLFAIVNLARWYEVDAESALREANARFKARFSYLDEKVKSQGKDMAAMTLAELDQYWEEAKRVL